MGFKKRAATTGKVIIPEGARKEVELIYLYDIVAKIETYNIPYQIAFNMDQTPSKYIQRSRYNMEKSASKSVVIAGYVYHQFSGKYPPDATDSWGGKTDRSLLKVDFPKGFLLSVNPRHCEKYRNFT